MAGWYAEADGESWRRPAHDYEMPDPASPGPGSVTVENGQFNVVMTVTTASTAEGAAAASR